MVFGWKVIIAFHEDFTRYPSLFLLSFCSFLLHFPSTSPLTPLFLLPLLEDNVETIKLLSRPEFGSKNICGWVLKLKVPLAEPPIFLTSRFKVLRLLYFLSQWLVHPSPVAQTTNLGVLIFPSVTLSCHLVCHQISDFALKYHCVLSCKIKRMTI